MQTVGDIMMTQVLTCSVGSSLLAGHQIMKDKDIRHLPVVDEEGALQGVLSQKEVLKQVFTIINERGMQRLERYEDKIPVREVMSPATSVTSDTPLDQAGEYFLKNKSGCLMVTDSNNKLVGIVSSHDFVKLSVRLLRH